MSRTLFFAVILGATTLFYYYNVTSTLISNKMSTQPWSSPFAAWHDRALHTPHPDPHSFTPTRDTLQLALLLNAPIEHEGISVAFFSQSKENGAGSETVAVDALGRVLVVAEKDAAGILGLAQEAVNLPSTGAWRNTWVIKRPTTSQPIDRLFIFPASGSATGPHEISVQGFSKQTRELKDPVGDTRELPAMLWELAGLVLEARDGLVYGEKRDEVVLGKVRETVAELF
ncbi:hypothetical protein D9615_007903 [Tricholomella constricta]|uniref:Uncharacterized protein n=1 Tax=Tricholomella constricta TaxID=117010 RepID=A0A8H5M0E3_9AGAR|nr:hypothetical protein D9615_007903 [Tricholomella constricta]